MDYPNQLLLLLAAIGMAAVLVGAGEIQVFGLVGGTVRLECNVSVSLEEPDVEWIDRVWGSEEKPATIFTSKGNPHFEVLASHGNHKNFRVSQDFALTISNLDMDTDVGQYTCKSRVGDHIHKKRYYLTIGELPTCSGNGNLRSGDRTSLSCEMSYSGNQPVLDWYEDDKMVKSLDEYDIRMAKKVVEIHASHRQDGAKLRCQMTLGSSVHECSIVMNVSYAVHQPKFHPDKASFLAGEELKCVAKGNPTPTVTFNPNLPNAVSGHGWVAVIIEPTWEHKQMDVNCSASNRVDRVEHTKWNSISFSVSAPSSKKPVHHQHSTVPPVPPVEEKVVQKKEMVETQQHHEPANQHSEHVEQDMPRREEKSKPPSKPDPKEAKSTNSAGNIVMFTRTFLLLSLVAALWI